MRAFLMRSDLKTPDLLGEFQAEEKKRKELELEKPVGRRRRRADF